MMNDEQMDDRKESNEATTETSPASVDKPKRPRGFAAMDPKLVSELATRGGKAAHRAGTAHEFTSEEARVAGRKGAMVTHAKRRAKLAASQGGSVQ
jgi:general stress protein YciG